jgi:hypothetical protein
MTCCFLPSLNASAISAEAITPRAAVKVPKGVSASRFWPGHPRPVWGDHWSRIRNIYCSPYHPQTNGELERFHETLKARLNLLVFTSPEPLRAAMAEGIEFYTHRRYREGIGDVTSADVYFGRLEESLKWRKEQKPETVDSRFQCNVGQASNQTRAIRGPNYRFERA